ncbi:MAG: thermonuclease family protein [Deltaproteobacteria bacterium]|nr:thermonuclease family protein [Deltaproteobacteria bacterium]
MRAKICLLLLVGLVFNLAGTLQAKERELYSGKVIKVSDGDTITVLTTDYERIKVRFYGIDSPEKKQPHGEEAQQALAALIADKDVTIEEVDTDRYSRVVGLVRLNGQLINLAMVEAGWAWLYPQYCKISQVCSELARAESKARAQGLGLWRAADPTEPWEFRKQKRKKS